MKKSVIMKRRLIALVVLLLALGAAGMPLGAAPPADEAAPGGVWTTLWNLRVAGGVIAIFLVMVALMYGGRISALLALPIMAVLFGVVAGVAREEIVEAIIAKGSLRLHKTYTVAFFGGMLALFVKQQGIAETVIKFAAELAGDKPLIVGVVLMGVTMLLFTTLGGLGAIIMVGTIILPILLSLGAPAYVAGGIFLIGLCAGGTLNPQAWQFYIDALGVSMQAVQNFAVTVAMIYVLIGVVFTVVGLRKTQRRNFLAVYPRKKIVRASTTRPLALLTPLVPIVLVIRLGQMLDIFLHYHQRIAVWKAGLLVTAAVLVLLAVLLRLVQKQMGRRRALLREAMDLCRPLTGLAAGCAVLLLAFALVPFAWLKAVQRAGLYWDTYFGAWEFIPAFVAALVFGLATTWGKYSPRAWIGGLAVFLGLWLLINGAQARQILASGAPLGRLVFGSLDGTVGLLTLNHAVPFVSGLVLALALSWDKRSIQILSRSLLEGAESVMPAVLLMLGIGMLLAAVAHPKVSSQIQPLLEAVVPTSRYAYIIVFTILAPLALYRGPLNIWGMGIGLAGVLLSMNRIPAAAVMGIFISVGALQGVCDPTNTHNVWIANYLGVEVLELTKKLIPFIWVLTLLALCVAGFQFIG